MTADICDCVEVERKFSMGSTMTRRYFTDGTSLFEIVTFMIYFTRLLYRRTAVIMAPNRHTKAAAR